MGRSSKSRGQTVYVIFAVAFEALFMELCHGERSCSYSAILQNRACEGNGYQAEDECNHFLRCCYRRGTFLFSCIEDNNIPPPSLAPPPKGPCQESQSLYSEPKNLGKILHGHVISTFDVSSQLHCADECLRHDNCIGFNYQYIGQRLWTMRKCELLDKIYDVQPKEGYNYHILNRTEMQEKWFGRDTC